MELPEPEQHIRNQEILDLRLTVVENLCPPVRVLAKPGIGMLKDTLAVKLHQPVRIRRKVCRNPVQNYSYPRLMQRIDKIHKVLRRSVARCRRIISCDLIAP